MRNYQYCCARVTSLTRFPTDQWDRAYFLWSLACLFLSSNMYHQYTKLQREPNGYHFTKWAFIKANWMLLQGKKLDKVSCYIKEEISPGDKVNVGRSTAEVTWYAMNLATLAWKCRQSTDGKSHQSRVTDQDEGSASPPTTPVSAVNSNLATLDLLPRSRYTIFTRRCCVRR